MLKKRYLLILVMVFISLCFIAFSEVDHQSPKKNNSQLQIQPQDRVLIIAPHPDDESIACAGVIRYCTENNISIKIVVLTDGSLRGSTVTRHDETVAAMKFLGVKEENILFLGYKDSTLSSLLNKNWDMNNPYNISGTTNSGNYSFFYQENATYSGEQLYANLAEIVNKFQPTIIFYPDSEDEQIDHWASNAFIEYVTAKTGYTGKKYTYIVHDPPNWPNPRNYNPKADLNPPSELTRIGYNWVYFPMNRYQERIKEVALGSYPSQISNDSYLRSFIRQNELFATDEVIPINLSSPTTDYFSDNVSLETIIKEPVKKDRGKGSIRSREINSVGFQIDEQYAWISIETKQNISNSTDYELHILLLDNPNYNRIDVNIYNGTVHYQNFSSKSYKIDDHKVEIENESIKLQIPYSAFKDTNSLLISADIIRGNTLLDWTGWQKIEIIK